VDVRHRYSSTRSELLDRLRPTTLVAVSTGDDEILPRRVAVELHRNEMVEGGLAASIDEVARSSAPETDEVVS